MTYEIGDYIRVGGYTAHDEVLTTFGGLSPDFINGLHIILGFETDTTVNTDYTYSFNVAIPIREGSSGALGYGTYIEAWTSPYTLAQTVSSGQTGGTYYELNTGTTTTGSLGD